jgi:hypothetical protein
MGQSSEYCEFSRTAIGMDESSDLRELSDTRKMQSKGGRCQESYLSLY